MIELLKNPTNFILLDLISNCTSEISLCCPFIKKDVISQIIKKKKPDTKLTVITTSNLASFVRQASDIEAIELLLKNGIKVYNHQHLHAKIYSFDNQKAIVTSANLTYNGLNKNYEYGILINDLNVVSDIDDDLNCLIEDELSGSFDYDSVDFIKKQMNFYNDKEFKIVVDTSGDELLESKHKIVNLDLQSWQKDVYDVIESKMNNEFTLREMYEYEDILKQLHPNNNNIRAKIRQILQKLRDKGIIKFEEPGYYKKLLK